ncbi:MAG: tRNA pseudouridine(55) synthase TruB [Rhizobiales bacterium]|nr:tRNA pseudouridine(55) synthase TruB [Hyphomicrobiales bacterium]
MGRKRKGDQVDGWVLFDKPLGMTSTRAVAVVRRLFNAQKAGHAGTLDPLATGMLPIALGEATKTVPFIVDATKDYEFTVCWGEERDTDDREGQAVETSTMRPEMQDIIDCLQSYQGEITQTPPAYSAIKIDGKRAYDLARSGEKVAPKPRQVQIHSLDLVDQPDADHARFRVTCGKGTYIRALARDMGRDLGCFGHVAELRRTRVGPMDEARMILLDKLETFSHKGDGQQMLATLICPVETALDDIPALAVSGADTVCLRQGQSILVRGGDAPVVTGLAYAVCKGDLVALGEVRRGELHPTRVFNIAGPSPQNGT